jgi:hypothetical protein
MKPREEGLIPNNIKPNETRTPYRVSPDNITLKMGGSGYIIMEALLLL